MKDSTKDSTKPSKHWYVLATHPGFERLVTHNLQKKGIDVYVPISRTPRQPNSEKLLFPGYLFCRCRIKDLRIVLLTPGAVDLLGVPMATPCDVDDFSALQKAVRSRLPVHIFPFVQRANRCRVIRGPLCGLEGFTLTREGKRYFAISVRAIKRTLAFNLKDCPIQATEKDFQSAAGRSAVKRSLSHRR